MPNIIDTIDGIENWRRAKDTSESELGWRRASLEKFRKVRDTVRELVDLNNTMSREKEVIAGIVAGLVGEHPHLQHKTILALLTALGEVGTVDRRIDGRNEFARGLCTTLRERFKDEIFWKD